MYSTCLHCNRPLGANESLEAFPVGRRLAFDAAGGRLWVVCRHCARWNLSPIEERWEAIEQGERAFRATRVRVSTDNIGMARLADGTDLVRIGRPLRPEFAAWRYGDQFGRRRVKTIVAVGGVATAAGLGAFGMATAGAGLIAMLPIFQLLNVALIASSNMQHLRPVPIPSGGWFRPYGNPKLVARPDLESGWGVEVGFTNHETESPLPAGRDGMKQLFSWRNGTNIERGRLQLTADDAVPLLRCVMPRVNRGGASRSTLRRSVDLIEQAGGSEGFGRWAATQRRAWAAQQALGDSGDLQYIPAPARLALEMALHEDTERRALEGELAALEAEWRHADEIARIADGLLADPRVERRLSELRGDAP